MVSDSNGAINHTLCMYAKLGIGSSYQLVEAAIGQACQHSVSPCSAMHLMVMIRVMRAWASFPMRRDLWSAAA